MSDSGVSMLFGRFCLSLTFTALRFQQIVYAAFFSLRRKILKQHENCIEFSDNLRWMFDWYCLTMSQTDDLIFVHMHLPVRWKKWFDNENVSSMSYDLDDRLDMIFTRIYEILSTKTCLKYNVCLELRAKHGLWWLYRIRKLSFTFRMYCTLTLCRGQQQQADWSWAAAERKRTRDYSEPS